MATTPLVVGNTTVADNAPSHTPSYSPSHITNGSPLEHQSRQSPMTSRPASHGPGWHPSPAPNQAAIAPGGMPPPAPVASAPSPVSQPTPTPTQGAPGNGSKVFHSPVQGQTVPTRDLKTTEEYGALVDAIGNATPAIARQVIRDYWDRCLLGSEYHTAFVLNAMLHQASSPTLNRAVQDFGEKMVRTSKNQLLEHFTAADFDQTADLILSKVSPSFLDRALAQRLETIDARNLVNALARAERLGYDVQDIVQEKTGDGAEHVIPSLPSFPSLPSPHQAPQSPAQPQWAQGPQAGQGFPPPGSHAPPSPWYNTTPGPRHAPPPGHAPAPPPPPVQLEKPPPRGPAGIHFCEDCYRPCSGKLALQYHIKKRACDPDFNYDKLEKTICLHCGCTFGSATGALYHMKSEVCGKYSAETRTAILKALEQFSANSRMVKESQQRHNALKRTWEQHTAPPTPLKSNTGAPGHMGTPRNNPVGGDDPYAHLTADTLRRYHEEQANAEAKYGALMREAMSLPEPERNDKLSKLKNSYNTKQSTTRKKYGIRLRERRTREDIEAERIRLLGRPDANEVWLEQERAARSGPAPPTPSQPATPSVQTESPRKRVPLSEMGGLSGSVGSAETRDPTAYLTSSQPRALPQMQSQASQRPSSQQALGGTEGDPMSIDDDGEQNGVRQQNQSASEGTGSETEESSSSDDEDIPATR